MKTRLEHTSWQVIGLRVGLVAFVLIGVIAMLLVTNSGPVEAAQEVTLASGNLLIATPEGCNLSVLSSSQTKVRLSCEAWTPTGESETVESASDEAFAPDAKVYRTVKAGKKLSVLSTANVCKLKVVEATASLVRIKCKPLPVVVTPTPTKSPTRTATKSPAKINLYLRNSTGGTLCYEVYNTGIGRKCFGAGDSFYGTFNAGTYTYKVEAVCGTLTDTINFPSGDRIQGWECTSGASSRLSQKLSSYSAEVGATPTR